jgi:ethanolaminephosphotransferase
MVWIARASARRRRPAAPPADAAPPPPAPPRPSPQKTPKTQHQTGCVERIPLWVAPNLITLVGTLLLLLAYAAGARASPDFTGFPPTWVYLASALAVVAYCHLDCLDGKQARRTRTSGPLGQLFDHGCDALSVNVILANIAVSLALPCGWAHGLGIFGVCFVWVAAQWEEYHTGVMLYGNEYWGVLEANYSIAAMHLLTVLVGGARAWTALVRDVLRGLPGPLAPPEALIERFVPAGLHLNEALIVFMVCMGSYQGLCNLYRVLIAESAVAGGPGLGAGAAMPPRERGNKQLGRAAAGVHLLALFATLGVGAALVGDDSARYVAGLCRAQSALFCVAYAHVATRLIVAHMSKEPFEPGFGATVLPMVLGVIVSRVPGAVGELVVGPLERALGAAARFWGGEVVALPACVRGAGAAEATWVLLALAAVAYLHYVVVVIRQICESLDVRCLTVKAVVRPDEAPTATRAAAATPARRHAAAAGK